MAPIVNGLETQYRGRVDFVHLNVADPAVRPVMAAYGFEGTPHFFLRAADGTVVWSQQGAVPEAELARQLDAVSGQ
jgi:thioredoxin-like negative regulator of GroEL